MSVPALRAAPDAAASPAAGDAPRSVRVPVESVQVSAYRIPTDFPESDGTLEWTSTTLVLVRARAAGRIGLGYSYADTATALLARDTLSPLVQGRDAMDVAGAWTAMVSAVRNLGRPGICSMAISAVDNCLWDLKAEILGISLVALLGAVRDEVPVYGSGGFTSYPLPRLQEQLAAWAAAGIAAVKMKVGRQPEWDLVRVRAAREAIGPEPGLFVDANGAYARKQALSFAGAFRRLGVSWFEEPVPSDDLEGLRLIRDAAPPGLEIVAGEYGYTALYFRRMLEAGAVDVLQADATRCSGITGFLRAAALCDAYGIPLSSHCAPSIHAHLGCAASSFRNLELFHDHMRVERLLFDGVLEPVRGRLRPDRARTGLGLHFKRRDAERYAI